MNMRRSPFTLALLTALTAIFFAGALALSDFASAQTPRKDVFNHLSTGFPLTGAHEQAKCESCHVNGIFKGTPKACLDCHGPGARISTVTMPQNHIPVMEACTVCHTTTKFYGARYSHAAAVPGNCTQCHNGTTTAAAKSSKHLITTASCDSCHRTSAWLPASFSHAGVAPGSCGQCHNGASARGKSATHLMTSASCDSCHTTSIWAPATRFDHAGVLPGTCTQCHNGIQVRGQKSGHIPTTAACDTCHTSSGWLPARVDHSGVVPGTCATCHDGKSATGKKANHIPTTASCDTCHRTTAWKPTSFSHKGVAPGSCAQCHNGVNAAGKPSKHLVTSSSCDSCHSTSGWLPVAFNHAGVAAGSCGTCHNGTTATGKTATHIPVSGNACDACHSRTNYTSFANTTMNHAAVPGVACSTCHEGGKSFFGGKVVTRPTAQQDPSHPLTGECSTCHTGTTTFALPGSAKPANHIPTTQACALCHTTPGNYTVAVMNHQGITSGCATCHGPGRTFGNLKPKTQPAGHIPVPGTACEGCHSVTNFTTFAATKMNHAAVPGIACQTCHETGRSWTGVTIVTRPVRASHPTTGDCGSCHTTTTFTGATVGKPGNHIPTNQACTLCHSNASDYKIYAMSHQGITSGCATCHGPGLVFATNFVPKTAPATHIPVPGVACESCHSAMGFTTFSGTAMNHAGVGGISCQTCHEAGKVWFGITTVTRPTRATHPATGDCNTCHTGTVSFKLAVAKPANHIPTTLACTTCHANPQDYKVYAMSHQGISSNCAQCHGPGLVFATNFVPRAPPATHIPTNSAACESCHSPAKFTTFSGTTMNHAPVSGMTCATCHETGRSFFGVTIVTRPVRATHPTTGDCSACHTTATFAAPSKPANHIPTTQACTLCHTTSDYSKATMSHQGIASNCRQCHGPGLSFANVVPKAPPATHIPVGSAACESCHSATTFTSFAGTAMNHAPVTGTSCATCHETGRSFFGVTIVTRPVRATHPSTGDCGQCHTTVTFKAPAKPANHIPTTQACSLCHTTANYSVAVMSHQGIASNCAQCHGPGLSFANVVPKAATHIPTGSAPCESCHSATKFTNFSGTAMNHAAVTGMPCATCHDMGKTFFGVTIVVPPAKHIPYTGVPCESCHSPTKFTNFGNTKMNHTPVAAFKCMACHELGMSWFGVQIVVRKDSKHFIGRDCNESGCHNTNTFSKRLAFPLGPTGPVDPRGPNPLSRPSGRIPQK
jgi:hypothetical protein